MTTDDFGEYDVTPMDDEAVRGFLESHSIGVLGLPAEDAPILRPLSFWFDGESCLYLLYVLGTAGRMAELSERADAARFLVYRAETPFSWRSVLLTGETSEVPRAEWGSVREHLAEAWRPAVLQEAAESDDVAVYEFRVDEWSGIESTGLPPGFETDRTEDG